MAVLTSFSPPRVDRRTLVAVGLAALAAALVLGLTRSSQSVEVLVAATDIPAGSVLDDDLVTVRTVSSDAGLISGTSIGELAGWSVAIDVGEGEPLIASLLVDPAIAIRPSSLSISLPEAHAALGSIVAGDTVDIYVTWPAGLGEPPRTELLVSGVVVLDARSADSSIGGRREVDLLFAVDGELAPLIAGGHRLGELDLVRVSE